MRHRGLVWFSIFITVAVGRAASGQDPAADDLRARVERLEQQNQEMAEAIRRLPATTVNEPGVDATALDAAGSVGAAADPKPGDELKMTARWNNGLRFETADKNFSIHIGTRIQYDNVWENDSPGMKAAPPTGVGQLEDGTYFRRVRLQSEGTFYQMFEFNTEVALESVQQNIAGLDEFWVGAKDVPILGTIRLGHDKVPQGLEGDVSSSSKDMTFLERASYTEAFYQNFATGAWISNNLFDQHMTWTYMLYRQQDGTNGDDFGGGEYGNTGRLTVLPVYEDNGRYLLHLGASATLRGPGPTGVDFHARPEMFDNFGALNGNSNAWVDTGAIKADSASVYGVELFSVMGPLSLQAEYAFAFANNAVVGGVGQGNLGFNGGYVLASYFLTGEYRTYDRRFGRFMPTYISSPNEPFFIGRDEQGNLRFGPGAWELAARYSYLNLNDGPIQGGILDGLSVGLNWYLNNNLKIQFQYQYSDRLQMPAGVNPGSMNGFGIRTQFFF